MQTITTIGLDIAKSVFQVHGVDAWASGGPPPLKRRYMLAFFQKNTRHAWSVSRAKVLQKQDTQLDGALTVAHAV